MKRKSRKKFDEFEEWDRVAPDKWFFLESFPILKLNKDTNIKGDIFMKVDYNTFWDVFEYRWKVNKWKKKDISSRTLYIFELECPNCGDEYIHSVNKKGEFCSLECKNEYKRNKRTEIPEYRDVPFDELKEWLTKTYWNERGNATLKTEKSFKIRNYNMYLKLMEVTSFLDGWNVNISQRVYHVLNGLLEFPVCLCGNPITKFISFKKGYNKACSVECSSYYSTEKTKQTNLERYGDENYNNIEKARKTNLERYGVSNVFETEWCKEKISKTLKEKSDEEKQETRKKFEQTCLEKYGVKNPFQSKIIQKKTMQTSLEKYGTEHPFQNKEIQDKYKQTNLEKYGVEWYAQSDEWCKIIKEQRNNETPEQLESRNKKSRQTCLERYGVDDYSKTDECKKRSKQTCLERYGNENYNNVEKAKKTNFERYGVEWTSQCPEISNKIKGWYKNSWHDYQLPSGKWIKLQGYEPTVLDMLLHSYDEKDISYKRTDMPEIWYNWEDGTSHKYFPDFYINKDNLVIEVKSDYTYKADVKINLLKEEATKEMGYDFKFMIFNGKKELIDGIKDAL